MSSRLLYGDRLEQCVDETLLTIQGLEGALDAIKARQNNQPDRQLNNQLNNQPDNQLNNQHQRQLNGNNNTTTNNNINNITTNNNTTNITTNNTDNDDNDNGSTPSKPPPCFPVIFIGVDGQQVARSLQYHPTVPSSNITNQPTLFTLPLNPPYQPTPSTHPINPPSSTHPINPPS